MAERSEKSSLLWNIVDPDDPYDIRKSMIARLPQHNQNLMCGNLELVCLMQAAQIERISQYLEQFKLKYRELGRKELDRHSYEIQIKQLTEKEYLNRSYYQQNQKLKEFIKRLTLQLEEWKQKVRQYQASTIQSSTSSAKYQELNEKYQSLLIELQQTRQAKISGDSQIHRIREQLLSLRMKSDQLQRDRLKQVTQQREKYELRIKQRIEIQMKQINNTVLILKSELNQLESKLSMSRQQIQSKNYEISSLQTRLTALDRQKIQFSGKTQELQDINSRLVAKSRQLEGIFKQYEDLQRSMRDIQKYCRDVENDRQQEAAKVRDLEFRLRQKQNKILILQEQNTSKLKNQDLQNKVALLSSEVERLNYLLETRTSEVHTLSTHKTRIEQQMQEAIGQNERELKSLRERNYQLELDLKDHKMNKNQQYTITLAKINQLQKELKNSYGTIKLKDEQIYTLEMKVKTNQQRSGQYEEISIVYKREIQEKDSIIRNLRIEKQNIENKYNQSHQVIARLRQDEHHKFDLDNKNRELVKKVQFLEESLRKQKTNNSDREKQRSKIIEMERQISRLHQYMESKQRDSSSKLQLQLGLRLKSFEERENRLKDDVKAYIQNQNILKIRIRELETDIGNMRDNYDRLIRKQRESAEVIINLQKKYTIQIQQQYNSIRSLKQQNQRVQTEKKKLRLTIQSLQHEIITKQRNIVSMNRSQIHEYEQKIQYLQKQNHNINNRLSMLQSELSDQKQKYIRLQRNSQEQYNKIYNEELSNKETLIKSLQRQIVTLKNQYQELRVETSSSQQTINNYKNRLLMLSSELERINLLLKNRNEQIAQGTAQLQKYKSQQTHWENFRRNQQNEKAKLQQYYMTEISNLTVKITQLQKDRQRLEHEIKEQKRKSSNASNEEINSYKQQIMKFRRGEENLQKKIRQFEGQIRSLTYQLDNKNKEFSQLRVTISSSFKSQKQSLEHTIHQYEGRLKSLNNELEIKNRQVSELRRQTKPQQNLQIKISQFEGEIRSLKHQLQTKNRQVGDLKNLQIRFSQLEGENRSLKHQIEIKNRELGDFKNLQIRISQFEGEIRSLKHQIQAKNREIGELKIRINTAPPPPSINPEQFKKYEIEITNLKQMIKQLEDINAHTVLQRDQLFRMSHQLKEQLQQARKASNFSQNKNFISNETHHSEINRLKVEYENKISSERHKIEQHYSRLLRETQIQITKIKSNTEQISRYEARIKEKQQEYNRLNIKFEELYKITHQQQEKIRYLQAENSRHDFSVLQNQNQRLSHRCSEYEHRVNTMSKQIQQMIVKIGTLQRNQGNLNSLHQQIHQYRQEIAILEGNIKEKQEDAELWAQKYQKLYYTYQQIVSNHEKLHSQYQKTVQISQQYEQRFKTIEGEFLGLEERIRMLKSENQGLNQQLYRLKNNQSLQQKNRHLSAQIDRLNILIETSKQQTSELRLRITDQISLQKRIEQYMALMVVLFAEIETLRNRVNDTEKECQNVRRSSLTPYRIDRSSSDNRSQRR